MQVEDSPFIYPLAKPHLKKKEIKQGLLCREEAACIPVTAVFPPTGHSGISDFS